MKYIYIIILALITLPAEAQFAPSLITVDTEKPFYFGGEEIRLNYHLVDFDNTLVTGEELVYVTLLDKDSRTTSFIKDLSKNGSGSCSILLPENIKSGMYELVIFTNYNRSFGDQGFFRQLIPIYSMSDGFTLTQKKIALEGMTFFPEGGHLVDGVASRVVYQFSHRCSNRVASLLDDRGKKVTDFSLADQGIGNFYFKPESKRSYKVQHNCDSLTQIDYPLQAVSPEAISLSLVNRGNSVQIILRTEDRTQTKDSIHLLAYSSKVKVYESIGVLNKGVLFTEIAKNQLPSGVISFFVLNKDNNVIANRSILLDFSNDELSIEFENNVINTSSEVKFKIHSSSKVDAIVDVKVVPTTWHELQRQTIINQLGIRENIDLNLGKTPLSPEDYKLIDDLLIVKSASSNIVPPSYSSEKQYLHESYLYLRGKFTDSKPLPDSTTLYFFIPEVNVIYEAKIDTIGFFEFPLLFDFYGTQEIPYYPYSKTHKFDNPKILSLEEKVTFSSDEKAELPWTEAHAAAKHDNSVESKINQVFSFYTEQKTKEVLRRQFDINDLISEPDVEFLMKEYISFANMEEVIKEILNGVFLRKRKSGNTLHMFSEDLLEVYKESPFIFIDNKPTKDIEEFLKINPADIERIRLVNRNKKLRELGQFGAGGLIIIDLKQSASFATSYNEKLTFNAIGLSRKTKNVVRSQPSNAPDMRNVLLWEPNQKIKQGEPKELNLITSDRPGDYIMVVESISDTGKIGYATKKIKVKFIGSHQSGKLDQE
jgi:hypothetical protein